MAVTSRLPLEFIAVVGVLLVTIAIVEVPRSNMRPPDLLGPDYQAEAQAKTRVQPAEAASPLTVPPADASRVATLEAELQLRLRELERIRAEVAAVQRQLQALHAGPATH